MITVGAAPGTGLARQGQAGVATPEGGGAYGSNYRGPDGAGTTSSTLRSAALPRPTGSILEVRPCQALAASSRDQPASTAESPSSPNLGSTAPRWSTMAVPISRSPVSSSSASSTTRARWGQSMCEGVVICHQPPGWTARLRSAGLPGGRSVGTARTALVWVCPFTQQTTLGKRASNRDTSFSKRRGRASGA